MKFVTYAATPGLDRFPEPDRFAVWRSIHKLLMRTDSEFRTRVRRFRLSILGTTIFFCAASAALGRLEWPPFLMQLPIYLILTVIYVAYVLRASLSTQKFQNERVGKALIERDV